MRLAAAIAAVALLPGVSPALAQPSVTPPYQYQATPDPYRPAGPTETHRYGAQVALADGLSLGAMLVGVLLFAQGVGYENDGDSDDEVVTGGLLMLGGAVGYVIGGPIVHGSKGNRSGAWTSVGLRLGLPFLGAAIGSTMHETRCSGDYCYEEDNGEEPGLFAVGMLTAMLVDWTILAKVKRPTPGYVPYATTSRDGDVTFGIAGGF